MKDYDFTLSFSLPNDAADTDQLVGRLGREGCTDALVGTGQVGRVTLNFVREASSAHEAIRSSVADVRRAIPDARLVEASLDFVG